MILGRGQLVATAMKHRYVWGTLLVGIALTGCVTKSKYQALEAQNAQLQQELAVERGELAADQQQITRLEGAIKYTVESDLLFPSGSWQLSKEGKDTLGKLAKKLAPSQQNKLVVIGHTDSTPIGPELERKGITSNEELSKKRAEAVRSFLITQGVDPNMVVAKGQGEANPVASNDTAKGRSQNRRVELSLGG